MSDYEQVEILKGHVERYNALLKKTAADLGEVYADIKRLTKAAQDSGLTVRIGWQEPEHDFLQMGQTPFYEMRVEVSRTTKL